MAEIELVDVPADPASAAAFLKTSLAFWAEVPEPGSDQVPDILDRSLLARISGEDVGCAAVIDFTLTLPGGARVAMDGVTWVAVSSVARRRGVLRAMMANCVDVARSRGIPVLGLGASESVIYRRFGYGVASHIATAEIDTAHAALRVPFEDAGRLRHQPVDDAIAVWRDIEARQADRVGAINRSESSWRRVSAGAAAAQDGSGPLQVVVHEGADGTVDGFVNYRLQHRWPNEVSDGIVHVHELAALNRDAHVALWQHVLEQDLMEHLRMERFWVDDPIQHLLLDPRRLRRAPRDDLHLRVVDVAAMLTARRYSCDGALVIEVRDPGCPDIEGRYRIDGGPEHAEAARTDAAADLVMDAPSLGSLLLGDLNAVALERAGLVREERAGAARRAGAMFGWSPRPWLNYMF